MNGSARMSSRKPLRRQRGVVTLVITLLVMIAITIGSFSLVQTSTLESRMTANDERSRDALHAAQAGVDFVLGHLSLPQVDPDVVCDVDVWAEHGFVLNFEGIVPPATELEFDPATQVQRCTEVPFGLLSKVSVWSRGFSGDLEAQRTLVSTIDLTSRWSWDWVPPEPLDPLAGRGAIVSKGVVDLTGNTDTGLCFLEGCIALARPGAGNREGNVVYSDPDGNPYNLVLAGGDVNLTGAADRFEDNVTGNDQDLRDLTNDEFFAKYVGTPLESATPIWNSLQEFRDDTDRVVTYDPSGTARAQADALSELITEGRDLVYVNGDLTLRNGVIGSPERPLVLVVDGDLNVAGNMIIWGTVFVNGAADFSRGTNKMLGSLVSVGDVDMAGNPAVYYNAGLAGGAVTRVGEGVTATPGEFSVSVRVGSWREVVR